MGREGRRKEGNKRMKDSRGSSTIQVEAAAPSP